MFRSISFSAEKELALDLVQRIRRDLPPIVLEKQNKSATVNRITTILERTFNVAVAYKRQKGLGFFGRVMLANHFKLGLKGNGYSEEFIDLATEGLVVALSKKNLHIE